MRKKYQTGSQHLYRKHFFNQREELDMDVPDGDIVIGKRVYDLYCVGCHAMFKNHSVGPMLHNIFGKTAGTQKGYKMYSHRNRALSFQWSKQRLYQLLCKFFLIFRIPRRSPRYSFQHELQRLIRQLLKSMRDRISPSHENPYIQISQT